MTFRVNQSVNQSLAKTAASVNYPSARPPRLIQIDAPFSSRLSRDILNELDQLDLINKKGGKHLDGIDLTWEHVVSVYPSIHWTLKTLLDAASGSATNTRSY